MGPTMYRHGHSRRTGKSGTYSTWTAMRKRCGNPNDSYYHRYGGRGISVCKRWADFQNFLDDMGHKPPGLSLDRINNDLGYKPSNCRWATMTTQIRNSTIPKWVTHGGERLTRTEWAARLGIKVTTFCGRLRDGWTVERATTTRKMH